MTQLTNEQRERYRRNILLPEVGEAGQTRLLDAKVLVIGLGGLGSPVSLYLAAAGVGTLGIADGDAVDLTNLQRQVIHFTGDVGRSKIESATAKLRAIRPDLAILPHNEFLDKSNIAGVVAEYDFVIDATDNFDAKLLINDTCVALGKPFVHGGIHRFGGQAMTVLPGHSACYRCIYQASGAPAGQTPAVVAGPLGPVAGLIGCVQATECLKYLVGMTDLLTDALLVVDTIGMDFRKVKVKRRDGCETCGALSRS
jgi:molybdopterin-synthase adenylyltransferase